MNRNAAIPFLDLTISHAEVQAELLEVFAAALKTTTFVGGPMVEDFENAFAAFCDAKHAIAVNSGTDALRLSQRCW